MKYRFLLLLAVAGVLAACVKEETGTSETGKVLAHFGIGLADVKTSLGEREGNTRKIFWSEGDCIAVNGVVSEPLAVEAAGEVTAVFDFTQYLTEPYDVLYPASMYKDESTITLPAVQTYTSDNFISGAYPMSARTLSNKGEMLSPLCALIKLPLKLAAGNAPDTDRIANLVFSGNDGEQVCGDFNIDYQFAILTPASSAEENKHLTITVDRTLSANPRAIVLVVPAGDYDSGFSIKVTDVAGHYMEMSKDVPFTMEAGHLYVMPEFEFVPTGTQLGIEISSANDLIAFAQNYNSKGIEPDGLIATLTQDIVFDETTSEAFNATGGIGLKNNIFGAEEDYYFNGIFNGEGHTISGLAAEVPLFTAIGGGGYVQDLTLDNSCSFTFTHPNTTEFDMGAVVGYHKGELKNVQVAAAVSLAAGTITQVTSLGGIVGRMTEGLMKDCHYSGAVSVPYEFEVDAKRTYVGGLVGSITNANGRLLDSTFEGTIDFAGTVASTDKTNPYLMVGGVVGSVNAGLVSGCKALGTATKEITMDNNKSYSATIQNHSRKAWHIVQGGIAGQNAGTVTGCTNEATIKNFVLGTATKGGDNSDANSRYYDLGGIVGLNLADASVSDCINNAPIETRCTPRIQKIGGVVGYNKGEVASCSNTALGSIYITTTNISSYSLRVGEVGGVIGNNEGLVSDLQNAGNISMDRTENAAGVELKFGGVIGITAKDIDGGEGKSISNSGNISDTYNGATVTTDGLRFGGVVGSAQASVQNVTNSGNVVFATSAANVVSKLYMGGIAGELRNVGTGIISGCVNAGEISFNVTKDAAHTDNYIGGILGRTCGTTNVAISDCVNSGYIHGGNGTKHNGMTCFVGGIVAYLDGASSIDNCENDGALLNNQFNNTVTKVGSTFEGGIAGFVLGTFETPIPISNVINNVNEGAVIPGGRRGFVGGTVGYGEYVVISEAANMNSYGGGSGYYVGGLAGWLVNSTVSGIFAGESIETSQLQYAGGIVAKLDAGSTIANCSSYLTTVTGPLQNKDEATIFKGAGALAGSSAFGSTISESHYKPSGTITGGNAYNGGITDHPWAICSDDNYTDGDGNVADL